MKKLIPVLMLLLGSGAGVGAGMILSVPKDEALPDTASPPAQDQTKHSEHNRSLSNPALENREYVKLNNQFIIPIVYNDRVQSLLVMALSVEVGTGQKEEIYAREPKLRDAFLQTLFDHANVGGFDGEFTNANNLDVVRVALREAAQKAVGDIVTDVLIIDVARQDS